ncbi:DNA-processing protein DprA [Pedobacter sp. KACC 23697]|uniref:DNA-processing protein DprA n=1 Tax=Pedobacter sp. KACC 23697 TaxID=3149230 RepID=A0AAU7K0P8_9SPHI
MKYTQNSINILTIKSFKGIGNAWIIKNLKGNESINTIISLLNKSIKGEPTTVEKFERLKNDFEEKLVKRFENCCDGFVALGDENFPKYRGNVKESEQPVFLYYKGNINLLDNNNKNISVIGLLNPQGNIEERERKIVEEFTRNGATIVSGLALGCDSISHDQALESNGNTIAILPSPLNNILPARNKSLAHKIIDEGGLLVTEYGNDFKSAMELSNRYKERDRLQALFCDTIVLAASYAKDSSERWNIIGKKLDSGARLAMGYAKDYSIPRAVMYDEEIDKDNPMFDLNRDIIEEQKTIITISQENYKEVIPNIIQNICSVKYLVKTEKTLFD